MHVDSGLTIAVNGRTAVITIQILYLQGSNNLVVYQHDGDKATLWVSYNGQESVKSFLSEYIDSKGNVTIDDNQVIFLMELGTTNKSRSYFDMQDLVVVATFEVVATQDDVSALEQEVQDAKEALVLATTNANSAIMQATTTLNKVK